MQQQQQHLHQQYHLQQLGQQSIKNVDNDKPILVPEAPFTRNVPKVSRIKQKNRYRSTCQYDRPISSSALNRQSSYRDWPPVNLGKNFPSSAGKCSSYDFPDCVRKTGATTATCYKDRGGVSESGGECIDSTEDGTSDACTLDYQTFAKYEHQNKVDFSLASHKHLRKNNGASCSGPFPAESASDVLSRSDVSPDSGIQSFPGTPVRNESPSHLLLLNSDNHSEGSQLLSTNQLNRCISTFQKPTSLSQQSIATTTTTITTTTINTVTTTSTTCTTSQVTLSSISCDLNRQICDIKTTSSASDSKHMGRRRGRGRPPKRAKNSWILQNKKSFIYAHLYAETRDPEVIERTSFSNNITLPEHIQANNHHTKDVNEFPFCQQMPHKILERNYSTDILGKSLSSYQGCRFQQDDGDLSPTRENKQSIPEHTLSNKKVPKTKSLEPFLQNTKATLFEKNKDVSLSSVTSKLPTCVDEKSGNSVSCFDKFNIHSNGKSNPVLCTNVDSVSNASKTSQLSYLANVIEYEGSHEKNPCLNKTSDLSAEKKGSELNNSTDMNDMSYLKYVDNMHSEISSNFPRAKKKDKLSSKKAERQMLPLNSSEQSVCQSLANSSSTQYSSDISTHKFGSLVKTVDVVSSKEKVDLLCKKMGIFSENKKTDSAFDKSYSKKCNSSNKLDCIPALQKADFDHCKGIKDSLLPNRRIYEDSPPVLMKAEDLPCSEKVKDPPCLEEYCLPGVKKTETKRKKAENMPKIKKAEKQFIPIKQDLSKPKTDSFVPPNVENGKILEDFRLSKSEKAEPINDIVSNSFVKKLASKMKDEQVKSMLEPKESDESKKVKLGKTGNTSLRKCTIAEPNSETCLMQSNKKVSVKKSEEKLESKNINMNYVSKNTDLSSAPVTSVVSRCEENNFLTKTSSVNCQAQEKQPLKQVKRRQVGKSQQVQLKEKSTQLLQQKDTASSEIKQKTPLSLPSHHSSSHLQQEKQHLVDLQSQKPATHLHKQKQQSVQSKQQQQHPLQFQDARHPPQLQEQPAQLQQKKQMLHVQQFVTQLQQQPLQPQHHPPKLLQQPPQLQQVLSSTKLLEQCRPPLNLQEQLPPQLYQHRPSTAPAKIQTSALLQPKESHSSPTKQMQQPPVAHSTKPKKKADNGIVERNKQIPLMKKAKSLSKKSINNHIHPPDSKASLLSQPPPPVSNIEEPVVKKTEESSEMKTIDDRLCSQNFVESLNTKQSGTFGSNIDGSKLTKIKDDVVLQKEKDGLTDKIPCQSENDFESFPSQKVIQNDVNFIKSDNLRSLQKLKKGKKLSKLQKLHLTDKKNTSEELLKLAEKHSLNAPDSPKTEGPSKLKRSCLVRRKKAVFNSSFKNQVESLQGTITDPCDSKAEFHSSYRNCNDLCDKAKPEIGGLLNGNQVRRKPGRPKGSKNKSMLKKTLASQKLPTMFEQPENNGIPNNMTHDNLMSGKLSQRSSRSSLSGSTHSLSPIVKRPRGRPRKNPTANALRPLENKRLRHLEEVTQTGLECENSETLETKRRSGLGQKLPSEEGDFDSLIRSVHDSIKSQFHGQEETEDFNDFNLTDNLDTIEPTLVNVCIQQETKPTRVVPKIRRPKLHVMMRRPRRGRRKKRSVSSSSHQSFLRSSFSSNVNLPAKASFSSFSSNNIHLNQPSFTSDGNSFSSFAATSTTISKAGFHSQSFKKFTRQCAKRKLISKKKKKRMLYFRSKHKNIVDPVFLADLDVIIGQFDSLIISESLEHLAKFNMGDKPMPSIFRLAKIISSKKKKKERQLTYNEQNNCHFSYEDMQCQLSPQVSPTENQQSPFHYLTDKSKKVKLRKELRERCSKDVGDRRNKAPAEKLLKEHAKAGVKEPTGKNRRETCEKVVKDTKEPEKVSRGSSLDRARRCSSLDRVRKGSLNKVRKGSSLDRSNKTSSECHFEKNGSDEQNGDIKFHKSYVKTLNNAIDKSTDVDNKISKKDTTLEHIKTKDSELTETIPEKSFAKSNRKVSVTPKSDKSLEKSCDKPLESEKNIDKSLDNSKVLFQKEENLRRVNDKMNYISTVHSKENAENSYREKCPQELLEKPPHKECFDRNRKDFLEKPRKESGEKIRKEIGEKSHKEKNKVIRRKSASEENLCQTGEEMKMSNQQCLPPKKRHKLFSSVQSSAEGDCNISNGKPDPTLQCLKTPEKRKVGRPRKHPLQYEELSNVDSGK